MALPQSPGAELAADSALDREVARGYATDAKSIMSLLPDSTDSRPDCNRRPRRCTSRLSKIVKYLTTLSSRQIRARGSLQLADDPRRCDPRERNRLDTPPSKPIQ